MARPASPGRGTASEGPARASSPHRGRVVDFPATGGGNTHRDGSDVLSRHWPSGMTELIGHARRAHRDWLFYVVFAVVMLAGYVPAWSIIDRWLPFETYLAPPIVETPMPVAPGDSVTILWRTRIHRECEARYSRRLVRDDGLTYQLGTHRGSYVAPTDANGRVFRAQFRVPVDAPPGQYVYAVSTDVRCTPWTHYVQESPEVAVEVR